MNYTLLDYLKQAYVQNAVLVAVLVALCAGLLGVILVLKRYSLIGDGLSHVTFGTMAVAAVFSVTELYISLPVTVLAAILLLRSNENAKIKGDAAVALISVSALAIAYLLFSQFSSGNVSNDVCKTLFGSASIMSLSKLEVWASVILAVLVILFFILFYHRIFAVTFDSAFSSATGVRTGLYNLLIAAITGIVIVLAMKLVGALLITALIIFPALSAMRLFGSFKKVTICAALLSVLGALGGILAALLISGLPYGSSIVVADLIIFLICSGIRILKSGSVRQKLLSALVAVGIVAFVFCLLAFNNKAATKNTPNPSAAPSAASVTGLNPPSSNRQKKTSLQVTATIFPLYDWTNEILGDNPGNVQVNILLENGMDLHNFQPDASDIALLSESNLFLYIGGESDEWVDDTLRSADNQNLVSLCMLDSVSGLNEETVEGMQESGEEEEEGETPDEHIWLSIRNAQICVQNISDALCRLDSGNASVYRANTQAYLAILSALDSLYTDLLEKSEILTILVADRFPFRYLAENYGLTYYAAFSGCAASTDVSFETVAFLADKLKELDLPAVLIIDGSDGELARTVTETAGVSAKILTLHSCQCVSNAELQSGISYYEIMTDNLGVLWKALNSNS